jgi:hypothetical protein
MANKKIKSVNLLPEIFKSDKNKKFLSSTLDQLIQPADLERIDGYVGSKITPTYNPESDIYLQETNKLRKDYSLEPAMVVYNTTSEIQKVVALDDLTNEISVYGGINNNLDRLYGPQYYSYDPQIDLDKFVNYQEYYWLVTGPDTVEITGTPRNSTSTYVVRNSDVSFIFTPDGINEDPLITLYRGNTYNFQLNSDKNLYIKIAPSPADQDLYSVNTTNNGTSTGILTIVVDVNTPSTLYYASDDRNFQGKILVKDSTENSIINVEKEVIGKKNYKSGNGIDLSNGMKIRFGGTVTPTFYQDKEFFIEGVGDYIRLIDYNSLLNQSVLGTQYDDNFDATPFDDYPFDTFKNLPLTPEYVTINRASRDLNPWTRYNRWFHSSVIKKSAELNGIDATYPADYRAKRPIIEFKANLQLYNFGKVAIKGVDLIDTRSTEVFKIVEGSAGYWVDGVLLEQGHRVIFNNDKDSKVRGKIYEVNYIIIKNSARMQLKEVVDPTTGDSISVALGDTNGGASYYFDGDKWIRSQQHNRLNQFPRFDLFDNNGYSYSNKSVHLSNFAGNSVFGYSVGTGDNDAVLGFPLKYKNSSGVGSYLFRNYFMTGKFSITENEYSTTSTTVSTALTYLRINDEQGDKFVNVWRQAEHYQIPILQFQTLTSNTSTIEINCIDNPQITDLTLDVLVNNNKIQTSEYSIETVNGRLSVNFVTEQSSNSTVLLKVYTDKPTNNNGFYETPLGLTNNPLNGPIAEMTLSEISDHTQTMVYRDSNWSGVFPGVSNIRDLPEFTAYGSRLISNATPMPFAQMFIGNPEHNVVSAIQRSASWYSQFKLEFLRRISNYSDQKNPIDAVDEILKAINFRKNILSPYYLSDMVAYGQDKTVRTWTVTSVRNTVYPISSDFNLTTLSLRSVLVYLNGVQLCVDLDYEFLPNEGSVNFIRTLQEGDVIEIHDYSNTEGCYIPPTPTKLGLYPKFRPHKYKDFTFIGTRHKNVIQGHDGSIMLAYNDYRDSIIVELERRIYNNIKVQYREDLFSINDVIPGAFRKTEYSNDEVTQILQADFMNWAGIFGIDYQNNDSFDEADPFTWNYTGTYNTLTDTNISGYWRNIYKYFYDTDYPHTRPWEMLGIAVKPRWWDSEYGPAPYTSGNELLWTDIEQGRIKQGTNAGINSRYARPGLSQILPVDETGKLISPDVLIAKNSTPFNRRQNWKFGDMGPVETSWRRSSQWPFAVQRLLALTKPSTYAALMFDTSRMNKNIAGQWTYGDNNSFLDLKNLIIHDDNNALTAGYGVYVVEAGRMKDSDYINKLKNDINYMNMNLFHKVGGFISKNKIRVIVDAIAPTSSDSGSLLPQENYTLHLNVSAPVEAVGISGIVIQKANGKYVIKGYDKYRPYFNTFKPIRNSTTPSITVGGISESFVDWVYQSSSSNNGLSAADVTTANSATTGHFYQQGQIVRYNSRYYRVKTSHTGESVFDSTLYTPLPSLPLKGGRSVQVAKTFESSITKVPYGTSFSTIQEVYDLIVGYGKYLTSVGFIFDEFNADLNDLLDWNFSAKEFLYWTTQNWADNSIITLSPFSGQIKFQRAGTVVDNIFEKSYDYSILKADGSLMPGKNLSVNRQDGLCTISTINTTDGIYFAYIRPVQKEHGMVFDNTTIFNDVIFDVETGYRQRRMQFIGFRTANWDGDYFSPGFVYDTAKVENWKKYTDYQYADVVKFNGSYYSAKSKIFGSASFNVNDGWVLLNEKPTADLLPNFDYKVSQFEDFYSLDIDNFDTAQQKMAQHIIGYTPRVYLNNIFTDPIAQYKFYQGFIKEKGTRNAVEKISKATIHNQQGELGFNEEWAFRTGFYGSYQTYQEIEFPLVEGTFIENPQIINFVDTQPLLKSNDLIYYSTLSHMVIVPDNYNPDTVFSVTTSTFLDNGFKLPVAGYVRYDDVDSTAYSENSLLDIANNQDLKEGTTIWLGFKNNGDWDVLRYERSEIGVIGVYVSSPGSEITFTTNYFHYLNVGDVVSITKFNTQVNGVYKITSIPQLNQFTVASTLASIENAELPSPGLLFKFNSKRYEKFDSIPPDSTLLELPYGTKFWIDNNQEGKWEVYQKTQNYNNIATFGAATPANQQLGYSISKKINDNTVVVGAPGYVSSNLRDKGRIFVYNKTTDGTNFRFSYVINTDEKTYYVNSSIPTSPTEFGYAVNYDTQTYHGSGFGLLLAGAPSASGVVSKRWPQSSVRTSPGAINTVTGYTTSTYSQEGLLKISSIDTTFKNEQTEIVLLDPMPSNFGKFGSSISINNLENTSSRILYVGAPGTATTGTGGNVYVFKIETNATSTVYASGCKIGKTYEITEIGSTATTNWNYVAGTSNVSYMVGDRFVCVATTSSGDKQGKAWPCVDISYQGTLNTPFSDVNVTLIQSTGTLFGSSISSIKNGMIAVGAPGYDSQSGLVTIYNTSTFETKLDRRRAYDFAFESLKIAVGLLPNDINYDITGNGRVDTGDGFKFLQIAQNGNTPTGVSTSTLIYKSLLHPVKPYAQAIYAPSEFKGVSNFGNSVVLSSDGSQLFVSAPLHVNQDLSQGAVVIYNKDSTTGLFNTSTYTILSNPLPKSTLNFGQSLDFNLETNTLVITAVGTSRPNITFDTSDTTFDSGATKFYGEIPNIGTAYVYNKKVDRFVLADELLVSNYVEGSNFGYSTVITQNEIFVGAPAVNTTATSGFYQFSKINSSIDSWQLLRQQEDKVEIDQFQRVSLINTFDEQVIDYLDIVDPLTGKIPGLADQEIKFKSAYDPAVYSIGVAGTVNDTTSNWLDEHVGELWWDLSTVKYVWYEQGELSYRKNNWGKLFPGATIDVYEWVGSEYLPSEWSSQADTSGGLTQGISGQPKFSDNSVISVKQVYNSVTNSFSNYYYYWVKNKVTLPTSKNRRMSAYQVSSLIADPTSYGYKYASFLSKNSVALSNIGNTLVDTRINLNVAIDSINNQIQKHTEWLLLSEGEATNVPNILLEKKLFDSLLGHDSLGNQVPDPTLPDRTKYGLGIRPQQTLFKDRRQALRSLVEFSNEILLKNQITGNYSFTRFNAQEAPPDVYSNEWDQTVEDNEALLLVDTVKFATAELSCTVKDGKVRSVSIINPGYGYRNRPTIKLVNEIDPISDAKLVAEIDANGSVISVTVEDAGSGYSSAPTLIVRPYTIIVLSDTLYNGKWTKFAWNINTQDWDRIQTQKYNTPLYWDYVDWTSDSYNKFIDYTFTVGELYEVNTLVSKLKPGQYVKVQNCGDGLAIVLEKTSSDVLGTFDPDFNMVFKENGTIQISNGIWDVTNNNLGFDKNNSYDQTLYDQTLDIELGYILDALKKDIFINELKVNWNLFFFKAVKYALTEQKLLDWAFKTSFINVTNYAGNLDQRPVYKLQNSDYYEEYMKEVKPYHSQIRKFTTNYGVLEPSQTFVSDFDLPSIYNTATDSFITIDESSDLTSVYPWKSWADNNSFVVESISVANGGANYIFPPIITIDTAPGDSGTGATAAAYIGSGKVIQVVVTNPGQGYKTAPIVTLTGGGNEDLVPAALSVKLGNNKIRTNLIGMKFDRVGSVNEIGSNTVTDSFNCNGETNEFVLNWLAEPDKTKITVTLDGAYVLSSDYTVKYYTESVGGYQKKFSKIVFLNYVPVVSTVLTVSYAKNIEIFTAAERILSYYTATSGMPGLDMAQLMDGVEYPKTQIKTIGFDYTSKWDNQNEVNGIQVYASPYGQSSWADDVSAYTQATVASSISLFANTNTIFVSTTTGISVGQYVNIVSGITNKLSSSTVKVIAVNTNSVKIDASTTGVILKGDPIEFWTYDSNFSILDSAIDGGTWSLTTSNYLIGALGVKPEDIIIDGDGFYTPNTSHAPEEFVPGESADAVGISVYTKSGSGSPLVYTGYVNVDASTNVNTTAILGIRPMNYDSITVVYNNKILQPTAQQFFANPLDSDYYYLNFDTNEILIGPRSSSGKLGYTIISVGGENIVDHDAVTAYFTSTGQVESLSYYSDIKRAYVTVDGQIITTTSTSYTNKYFELTYANPMDKRAVARVHNLDATTSATIQAWFFDADTDLYNEIREETYVINSSTQYTGGTVNRLPGNIEPYAPQVILEVNFNNDNDGYQRLLPPFVSYYTVVDYRIRTFSVDNNRNHFNDFKAINTGTGFTVNNVLVYVNGVALAPGFDYTVAPDLPLMTNPKVTIIDGILATGDVVAIVAKPDYGWEYDIVNKHIVLNGYVTDCVVKIITYTDHDKMLMWTERFSGNTYRRFKIGRKVLNNNYVWVQLNRKPLVNKIDYILLEDGITVQLSDTIQVTSADEVLITTFSSQEVNSDVLGYRIFNDILGRTSFKRISKQNSTYLTEPLSFTHTEIHVADASVLTPPSVHRKVPGVVLIDGERVEFYKIVGNTLTQLRRGTLGTGPNHVVEPNTKVIDQGINQTVPFSEQILVQNTLTSNATSYVISTSSSLVIGDGIKLSVGPVSNVIDSAKSLDYSITALKMVVGILPVNLAYDLNGDGLVTLTDAIAYIKISVGKPIGFTPVTTSNYNELFVVTYPVPAVDQVSVYYGGRLLNKKPTFYHDTSIGYDSPEFNVIGSTSTVLGLPVSSINYLTDGDAYIVTATNQVWVYKNSVEIDAVNGFVYRGLNYLPAEFSINTSTQTIGLNIKDGVQPNIRLSVVKKQFARSLSWNSIVDDLTTLSLLDSTSTQARFLQARPAELPDKYYYGGTTSLTDSGISLTDRYGDPLTGL